MGREMKEGNEREVVEREVREKGEYKVKKIKGEERWRQKGRERERDKLGGEGGHGRDEGREERGWKRQRE